jgi:hypothetical protein
VFVPGGAAVARPRPHRSLTPKRMSMKVKTTVKAGSIIVHD